MTTQRYTGRTLEARLAARTDIDPLSGCHLWQGTCNRGGYAVITLHGKRHLGHRLAWTLKFGAIPPGLVLCHRCDERRCVNPDHLFLGTHALNSTDRKAKMKARATPPAAVRRGDDRAQIRIVYRGIEMVGEVAIRPLLGIGAGDE